MRLPNRERADVPKDKIVKYLLSEEHPDGGPKAKLFIRFGFSVDHWEVLRAALYRHAQEHEVTKCEDTEHGTVYIVDGGLESPDGRDPLVRSVWQVDRGKDYPRLISAYKLRRRGK